MICNKALVNLRPTAMEESEPKMSFSEAADTLANALQRVDESKKNIQLKSVTLDTLKKYKEVENAILMAQRASQAVQFTGRTMLFAMKFQLRELRKTIEVSPDSDAELIKLANMTHQVGVDYTVFLEEYTKSAGQVNLPANTKSIIVISVLLIAVVIALAIHK